MRGKQEKEAIFGSTFVCVLFCLAATYHHFRFSTENLCKHHSLKLVSGFLLPNTASSTSTSSSILIPVLPFILRKNLTRTILYGLSHSAIYRDEFLSSPNIFFPMFYHPTTKPNLSLKEDLSILKRLFVFMLCM